MLLRILLVSFISGAFAMPTLASAQGFFGPIVHCGNDVEIVLKSSGDPRTAHCERPGDYIIVGDCEFCDIVQIANRIIRFLVAATVLVATIMFVYAGILFLTAGANEGNVSKAKGIFWSVLLGLVFVLASWLIIDIIMRTLYDDSAWGPWNEILCKRSDPNETCHSLNTEREGGIDGGAPTEPAGTWCYICTLASGAQNTDCSTYNQCNARRDTICLGTASACALSAPTTGPGGTPVGPGHTMSDAAILAAYGATEQWADEIAALRLAGISPDLYRALMMIESAGDPSVISPAGAVGLMQVMVATARPHFPDGTSDADIRAALLDPVKNTQVAANVLEDMRSRAGGSEDNLVAMYNGGGAAILPSANCPGILAYQCPWDSDGCWGTTRTDCTPNTGFIETRNYVANYKAIRACMNIGTCRGTPPPPDLP
jgi:hypothetical protein